MGNPDGFPRRRAYSVTGSVVRPFDGVPTLMLRAANARQNVIVEATAHLRLVREEATSEGFRIRRIRDLALVRDQNPVFVLSWTLMHVIDETSPLCGLTPGDLKLADTRMLASIVCIDPVIQAPVQSQTEYLHEQIAWNRRFAEIYT